MDSNDTFLKWFKIITTKGILRWDDMDCCINELLPGYSFSRSAYGPRAIKYIYDDKNKQVFKSNYNYGVGLQALQMAADTDYKKAILAAYDTKKEINYLLRVLKSKLNKFDLSTTIKDGKVDISVKERSLDSQPKKVVLW